MAEYEEVQREVRRVEESFNRLGNPLSEEGETGEALTRTWGIYDSFAGGAENTLASVRGQIELLRIQVDGAGDYFTSTLEELVAELLSELGVKEEANPPTLAPINTGAITNLINHLTPVVNRVTDWQSIAQELWLEVLATEEARRREEREEREEREAEATRVAAAEEVRRFKPVILPAEDDIIPPAKEGGAS